MNTKHPSLAEAIAAERAKLKLNLEHIDSADHVELRALFHSAAVQKPAARAFRVEVAQFYADTEPMAL